MSQVRMDRDARVPRYWPKNCRRRKTQIYLCYNGIQSSVNFSSESDHSALHHATENFMKSELFRTIGSTNQKLSTPQHDNFPSRSTSTCKIWDGGSLRVPYAQ
ncbi:hypothetical protein TNCV_576351 [Trichonephila clavipes]|nr:hypothetical protein TNCV_576351 [Trichonephila clavipes]